MKNTIRIQNRMVLSLAALSLVITGPSAATTYNVDRFDDSTVNSCSQVQFDDCALRGAIIAANINPGADIVRLHSGTYALSRAGTYENLSQTGDLDVTDDLLIVGDGPDKTVIDAAGIDRVLHVLAPGSGLTLRGVTIKNGAPSGVTAPGDSGAGVRISEGWLRVESCHIIHNSSTIGYGGGVSDFNATSSQGITIVDSWISGNQAGECSGLYAFGNFRLDRSTVSENTSIFGDGAVCAAADGAILSNSTIALNATGGVVGGVVVSAPSVSLTRCTLADNGGAELAASFAVPILANNLIAGTCWAIGPISTGGNLESPGDTCGLGGFDVVDVADPMLSPLEWCGGPTPIYRPLPGSPVVDHPLAGPNCPPEDQRGLSRPRDGDGDGGAACDIGAVELAGVGELTVATFESGFLPPGSP